MPRRLPGDTAGAAGKARLTLILPLFDARGAVRLSLFAQPLRTGCCSSVTQSDWSSETART